MCHRIAIGAAQFGPSYGIANKMGRIDLSEARNILHTAWSAGIDTVDTAAEYGRSEQVLGEVGVGQWQVITKLPGIPADCPNPAAWTWDALRKSLQRLSLERVAGILLHRPAQLLGGLGPDVYEALLDIKLHGITERIGYSVYSPSEFDYLWDQYPVDLVQIPLNVLDRRLITSRWLARLKDAGVEVHVRSIFLQGLLLMNSSDRPARFDRWASLWETWNEWLKAENLSPLQACVGFALSHPEFDRIVVGVDSAIQLREIVAAAAVGPVTPPVSLVVDDEDLLNPSRWNSL